MHQHVHTYTQRTRPCCCSVQVEWQTPEGQTVPSGQTSLCKTGLGGKYDLQLSEFDPLHPDYVYIAPDSPEGNDTHVKAKFSLSVSQEKDQGFCPSPQKQKLAPGKRRTHPDCLQDHSDELPSHCDRHAKIDLGQDAAHKRNMEDSLAQSSSKNSNSALSKPTGTTLKEPARNNTRGGNSDSEPDSSDHRHRGAFSFGNDKNMQDANWNVADVVAAKRVPSCDDENDLDDEELLWKPGSFKLRPHGKEPTRFEEFKISKTKREQEMERQRVGCTEGK
jgi:hypothetical protein